MNDFDNFDKYFLIGAVLITIGVFLALLSYGLALNEFVEASKEM